MFGLGPQEMIVIVLLGLLLFGPKKLPELGRKVGKAIKEFKDAYSGIEKEIKTGMQDVQKTVDSVKKSVDK